MTFSRSQPETQLQALLDTISAQPGYDSYFRALVNQTPLLFKLISSEPLGYLFRIRMASFHNSSTTWHETLPEEYRQAEIKLEIEDDYAFLWIKNASSLRANQIVALLQRCINDHPDLFPQQSFCFDCRSTDSVAQVQFGATTSLLCHNCLNRKKQATSLEYQRLNWSNSVLLLVFPLAIILSSLVWALFWILYQAVFDLAGTDHIMVPEIVAIAIVALVGIGVGWPVGKLLLRSGLVNLWPPILLTVLFTAVTLGLGELLLVSYYIYQITGQIDFFAAAQNISFSFIKCIFAAAVGISIFINSSPEKPRIEA